jgi:hypothetical protein
MKLQSLRWALKTSKLKVEQGCQQCTRRQNSRRQFMPPARSIGVYMSQSISKLWSIQMDRLPLGLDTRLPLRSWQPSSSCESGYWYKGIARHLRVLILLQDERHLSSDNLNFEWLNITPTEPWGRNDTVTNAHFGKQIFAVVSYIARRKCWPRCWECR